MEKCFEKLSSYNFLNNLLPGAIFDLGLKYFVGINLLQNNILDNLFIYYFTGLIISRCGSIIIEPILRKIKFVNFASYNDFLIASKVDSKIDILSETNNTYRTFLSAAILILLIKLGYSLVRQNVLALGLSQYLIVLCLVIMFAISYRKQTSYIKKRVEKNKGGKL